MRSSSSIVDTQHLLETALGRPTHAANSRMRQIHWRTGDVMLGLVVLIAWRLAMLGDPDWMRGMSVRSQFFLTAGFPALWMLLYPLLVAKQRGIKNLFSEIRLKHFTREAFIAVPVVLLLTAALALMTQVSVYFGGEPLGTANETSVRHDVLALLVLSVVIAPFAEELFFRGFFYNSFRRQLGTWAALMAQATLFALMHSYSASRTIVVFFLGLSLGMVYEWRKTLISPVMIHASINLLAAAATMLSLLAQFSPGYLGVSGEPMERGYLVTEVDPGGPAEQAGLQPGDVIVQIADQQPDASEGLKPLMRFHKAGDIIRIRAQRDGQPLELDARLGQRPGK